MHGAGYEGNILSMLSYASTQATWTAATTLARACHIETRNVIDYLKGRYWRSTGYSYLGQVASHYRYEYLVRKRFKWVGRDGKRCYTWYLSAVRRGYRL